MDEKRDKLKSFERAAELIRQQNERDAHSDKVTMEYLDAHELPTHEEVRKWIKYRAGETREAIMQHHVFWKEKSIREGLDWTFQAAHQAYVDICRHDAALGSIAKGREFQDHIDHTVGYAAQKDVVAYCSLASGYLDTLRRIQTRRVDIADQILEALNENSDEDITVFIKDMRKNLSHGSVTVVHWQVSRDGEDVTGNMTLSAHDILEVGEWNRLSKKYISEAADGKINIADAVGEHFKLFKNFDQRLNDIFARNVTEAEADFYEIEDEHRRWGAQQWGHLLVSQIGRNRNPYDYLHRFFTPEEVREILRYPKHSKEQVDFIITLKSPHYACDDGLRKALYHMFGVTGETA